MKLLLLQFFTWWNGATWGTRLYTWWKGELVGEDVYGNRYYKERGGQRRWVIFNGEAEASRVPTGWYGWLHGRTDVPPPDESWRPHPWEKPHQPNLTGTPGAYRPKGSILTPERRPEVTGDYDPWRP